MNDETPQFCIADDQWAVAALGTLMVIDAIDEDNKVEDVLATVRTLISGASPTLKIKAVVSTLGAMSDLKAEGANF